MTFHAETSSGFVWRFRNRNSSTDVLDSGSTSPAQTGQRTPKLARLEAVLIVANGALNARRLAQFATLADPTESRTLVRRLNEFYDAAGSAFRIEQVASGYQLLTRSEYALWLSKLHQRQAELKLSPPALETLAIIAYRQPIIRADIEAIRGVGCIEILKQLMDRSLVKIAGAEESLGRPHLYEVTRRFLEIFGLRSIEDLPMADRLRRGARPPAEAPSAKTSTAAAVQPPHFTIGSAVPVGEDVRSDG